MAKATIEICGKDSSGAAFASARKNVANLRNDTNDTAGGFGALQEAAKKFGNETRDATDIGAKSMEGLASVLDGRLSTAARGAGEVVKGFMSAGIWGVAAGIAKMAIEAIAGAFEAARERAMAFTEYLGARFAKISEDFASAKTEIGDLSKDMDAALKLANATVTANAKMKIHTLHYETLQKITDDLSESGKKMIEADEKYAAAQITAAANAEIRENERKAAQQRIAAAEDLLAQAEEQQAEMEKARGELTANQIEVIGERNELQASLARAEEMLKGTLNADIDYQKIRAERAAALAKFEEEHADVLKVVDAGERALVKATNDVAAARRELTAAENEAVVLAQKHREGLAADADATKDALFAKQELAAAERAAAENERAKAEQEQRLYEVQAARQQILAECKSNEIEANKILQAFSEAMENGCTATEALTVAQEKLNEEIDARATAEKEAADAAKKAAAEKAKADAKKAATENFVKIKADIDETKIKGAIDASENPRFQDILRAARDAKREARNELARSRRDQTYMVKYLKDQMPAREKELFENFMLTHYSLDRVKDLYQSAIKSELLSKSEAKRQYDRYLVFMQKMEQMGVK